jgi:uncharacterized lipoprotein
MNSVIRVSIVLLLMAATSCSYIAKSSMAQNRDKSYLAARSIPPLKIPPGIGSSSFHSAYPVSDRQYPIAAEDVSIIPPGLNR